MSIDRIRQAAAIEAGRRFFEEAPAPSAHAINQIEFAKVASVRSRDLFTTACLLRPENPFAMYEEMGGQYKVADSAGRPVGNIHTGRKAPTVAVPPVPQLSPEAWAAQHGAAGAPGTQVDVGQLLAQKRLEEVAKPATGLGRGLELLTGGHERALRGAEDALLQHAGGVAEHRLPDFQQHAQTVSGAIENEAKNVARARGIAGGALGGLAAGGAAAAAGVAHHRAAQEAARKAFMAKGLLGAGGLVGAGLLAHHALSNDDPPPVHQGAV